MSKLYSHSAPQVLKNQLSSIVEEVKKKAPPRFRIRIRSLSNTVYDEKNRMLVLGDKALERSFNSIAEVRAFMQTCLMSRAIYDALKGGDHPTIRDLYYYALHTIENTNIESFNGQDESDAIIQDIEVLTGLLREDMGVVADSRGSIVGNIVLESKGNKIDCSRLGIGSFSIPSLCDQLRIHSVDAEYVLVIEKDAIFQRLNDLEFWRKNKCILVTGRGQPDRATRRMVRRLIDDWKLPLYVLTDADPYGWYIYSTYKAGSVSLSYESFRLACPEAAFLGMSMSDIEKYDIPKDHLIKASDMDIKRAKELLYVDEKTGQARYPWFAESAKWNREIKSFLKKKMKAEIESKSAHGFRFLSDVYLPDKISTRDFIN